MAIITEEEEDHHEPKQSPKKTVETKKPSSSSTSSSKTQKSEATNPFAFWFYFTVIVSLITLVLISFNSLSPQDPKSWFLSLPTSLRQHYSKGRNIKVQTHSNQSPIEVFTFEQGPVASENVVLVHGLGLSSYSFRETIRSLGAKGVHAVAIDLPGNGFSDKSVTEVGAGPSGVLGRFWDVYSEIQENGLFSAFDEIVATGQIPYEEIEARMSSKRKVVKPVELNPEEIGKVLGQVIETLGLAPVHLVLHDSALGMSANWVLENSKTVRSVTLVDTDPRSKSALPLWILEMPVIRELVLGFSYGYSLLIKSCCSKGISAIDLNAHRVLLNSKDARRAVVGMGKKLNYSFDISEWSGSDELKGVPLQVLWSNSWSKEWTEEGRRVADTLPQATFVTHSGGRWPQEDAADQVAQSIIQFVSSLPPTVRKMEEEPIPEHIQRMLDEAKNNGGDHHHHHHGHGGHDHHHGSHGHVHEAGYVDAYGLGHGHGAHGW
ncbi:Alpha/beta hydrolase fold [Trema orientale]|uniref:Alpha/beta hydrolase fold n=1 Tax=Trema orientale TaxID=63057 RepID=A0A2P5CFQ9_TREOI|nr:Alpha/beta hydrolase fold [Trema orientale]